MNRATFGGNFRQRVLATAELIPLGLLLLAWAGFVIAQPAFLSSENLSNMFAFIPELGIVALGMTLLLTAGVFDLSVGAVFGFVPLLMFTLVSEAGIPPEFALLIALAVAAMIGLSNGLLVAKVGITSFLVTMATLLVVRGFGLFMSEGFPQTTLRTESPLRSILVGTADVGPFTVHAGLIWFLGLAAMLYFLLNRARFGNWIMATGGNAKAAEARGVPTVKVRVVLFVLSAVLAGFAGIISGSRLGSAYPVAGTGYELEVIAMAVVGGTSLFGGKGTIIGTIIGVILLRSIRNGIIVIGVPGLAYAMFVGLIILMAVSLQALIERRQLESR